MIKIIADARLALTPQKFQPLLPADLFSTPTLVGVTLPISGLTPKMDRVRSVFSTASVTTFMRSLDFFDSQSSFDTIFGSYPTMLRLSKRGKSSCTTEDKEYIGA